MTPVEARNGNIDKKIKYELRPTGTEMPWEKFELGSGESIYVREGWTAIIGDQESRRLEINGSEVGGEVIFSGKKEEGNSQMRELKENDKWIDPTSGIIATGRKNP